MSTSRPNILLFFTDQQRWDSMGLHGNPLHLTPNLDRFARRGTFLQHFFACQPVCGPARSCHDVSLRLTGALDGGPFTAGCTRSELTSLLDIPPTLLEVAGTEVPDTMDGRSLLSQVDPARRFPPREHIYAQISEAEVGRCIRTTAGNTASPVRMPRRAGRLIPRSGIAKPTSTISTRPPRTRQHDRDGDLRLRRRGHAGAPRRFHASSR